MASSTFTPKSDDAVSTSTLETFFADVQRIGKLRTSDHARRWTTATLNMLGVNLSRRVKRALANELPPELKKSFQGVFWLAYFRDTNMPAQEFLNRVSRRSRANSDPDFAEYPVRAVFSALKQLLSPAVITRVRDDLAPEISQMWDEA